MSKESSHWERQYKDKIRWKETRLLEKGKYEKHRGIQDSRVLRDRGETKRLLRGGTRSGVVLRKTI